MNTLKIKTRWIPGLMNIIGLGLAFSVFLVLMGQVWYDYSYDRFDGGRDVFVLEVPCMYPEGFYVKSVVRPIIQMVADCSPEIEFLCDYVDDRNVSSGFILIKDQDGRDVNANGIDYAWTETSVLDVFNVSLLEGRREDFCRLGDALISESAAKILLSMNLMVLPNQLCFNC